MTDLAEVCSEHIARLNANPSVRSHPANLDRLYIGSIYSVQDWLVACEDALDSGYFDEVRGMMERDGWDMECRWSAKGG